MTKEAHGWVHLVGLHVWALEFMRVERVPHRLASWRWKAWDVLRVPQVRPTFPTTTHKTLKAAKAHCEAIVREGKP